HVLCEKPIGLSAAEGQQLLDASRRHPKLKVMECFMYRHHPQWQRAKQLVEEGDIGALRTIQSFFAYFNDDPGNIRNQRDIGGGALMDIGCYCVSLSRFIFDDEPKRVLGAIERDPKTNVDRLTSAELEFFQGTSTFTCSTQLAPYQRVNIFGTAGRIEIEIPFNAPIDKPCRLWLQSSPKPGSAAQGATEEVQFEVCNQYTLQADTFARAIFDETPAPSPIADALANMRVIERIFKSAESGAWT
ncbi:MAG TPA: Gfo/Idh/MocA family oxidoreductase, partial [Pirellulales bacterium]